MRCGIDFVFDFISNFLIGMVLGTVATDVSNTVSMVGLVSNMPSGIRTISSSSSLALSLANGLLVSGRCGIDFVFDFLIGMVLGTVATNLSRTVSVVGSVSKMHSGIGTVSSFSSSGAVAYCYGLYTVMTGTLRAGGAVPS